MATDALTILTNQTAVTASFNSTALPLPNAGTPPRGFVYRALINNVSGTTPTLALVLGVSYDNGTTYKDTFVFRNPSSVTTNNLTANGEYYTYVHLPDVSAGGTVLPFLIRVQATIGGTTPSFDIRVDEVPGKN